MREFMTSWMWEGEPHEGYSRAYKRLVPLPVRRWGGYWGWIVGHYGLDALRGRYWRSRHALENRFLDGAAVTLGYCNFSPYRTRLKAGRLDGGGYSHWRCQERRRHALPHRFVNYVSDETGAVSYAPVDVRPAVPRWLRHRRVTERRWEGRTSARLNRELAAAARAKREGHRA